MYRFQQKIGEFNTLPIFENWDYSTDAGGGVLKTLTNAWYMWAKMTPRQGGRTFIGADLTENNQSTWIYDMEVWIRYTSDIRSDSTMIWHNKRYGINYFSIHDEGKGRFIRLFVTMIDDNLVSGGEITPSTMAYVYNYTAQGGETIIDEVSLINKTPIGVFKEGLSKEIIFVGIPLDTQVLYEPALGKFTFGLVLVQDEKVQIQYV